MLKLQFGVSELVVKKDAVTPFATFVCLWVIDHGVVIVRCDDD